MAPKLAFVLPIVLLGWAFQAILRPPPTKLCGSPGGPPLTSPRIKLRDGRYLAYREDGVQKDKAKYKIITVHAFDSTKDIPLLVSKELVEELGIYLLAFDRAGYGESDPNPRLTSTIRCKAKNEIRTLLCLSSASSNKSRQRPMQNESEERGKLKLASLSPPRHSSRTRVGPAAARGRAEAGVRGAGDSSSSHGGGCARGRRQLEVARRPAAARAHAGPTAARARAEAGAHGAGGAGARGAGGSSRRHTPVAMTCAPRSRARARGVPSRRMCRWPWPRLPSVFWLFGLAAIVGDNRKYIAFLLLYTRAELSRQAFKKQVVPEQRTLWIAHNIPSLLYLWMTQKWLPSSAAAMRTPEIFSKHDVEVLQKIMAMPRTIENRSRQQGIYESIHRDLLVAFGSWEFDPMNVTNPFPQNEGSVHIWQGYEDRLVLVELQRYIAKKLPWIKYHEVAEGGHMFMLVDGWTDQILRALLVGEEPSAVQL